MLTKLKELKERFAVKEPLRVSSKKHMSALRTEFHNRLTALRKNRSAKAQEALTKDFEEVLHAWGIAHEDSIPVVLDELHIRCAVFALPILCGLFAVCFLQSLLAYLCMVFFILPCLLGIIVTAWRISVLKRRQFVPFLRWLLPW